MAGYIGSKASVVSSGAENKKVFTATAGQTSFTGLTYSPNRVHVFQNGVRLVDGTDYTATNGNSITLTVGAAANDQVVVVSYSSFQTSDTVSASAGGTFLGDVNFTGAFTSQGIDDNATATAMTLDASGNLLMGKTATGLANQGAEFSSTGQVKGTAPNQVVGYFNRTSSDGSILEFRKDNSTVGSIANIGSAPVFRNVNEDGITLLTDDGLTRLVSTNSSGIADADGTLGTSSYRWRDLYLSGGVYLGGTGSANKLDDYEEGTWDARPSTSQSSVVLLSGWGYGNNSASYVKIGRLVICQYYFEWTNTTSNTGTLHLVLPFAVNATSNQWSGNGTETSRVGFPSGASYITVRPENNQSYATFKGCGNNLSRVNMQFSHFGTTAYGYALGSFAYMTA